MKVGPPVKTLEEMLAGLSPEKWAAVVRRTEELVRAEKARRESAMGKKVWESTDGFVTLVERDGGLWIETQWGNNEVPAADAVAMASAVLARFDPEAAAAVSRDKGEGFPADVPVGSSLPGAAGAGFAGRGSILPAHPPPRILRNVARCNACGEVVESRHRHDFVSCACGETSVDGGREYLRRVYGAKGYTEMSEHEGDDAGR